MQFYSLTSDILAEFVKEAEKAGKGEGKLTH